MPKINVKTYIISGDKIEYDHFIGQLPITSHPLDFHWVMNPDTVRGIWNPHGLFIGTWRRRYDIVQIVMNLIAASNTYNPVLHKILNEVEKDERK